MSDQTTQLRLVFKGKRRSRKKAKDTKAGDTEGLCPQSSCFSERQHLFPTKSESMPLNAAAPSIFHNALMFLSGCLKSFDFKIFQLLMEKLVFGCVFHSGTKIGKPVQSTQLTSQRILLRLR